MPRAIGSAGDWNLRISAVRLGVAARLSRVALSVAIARHIETQCRHCERKQHRRDRVYAVSRASEYGGGSFCTLKPPSTPFGLTADGTWPGWRRCECLDR